jgi:hypothetical protein
VFSLLNAAFLSVHCPTGSGNFFFANDSHHAHAIQYAIQLFLLFPWDSGFLPWPVESPDSILGPGRDIAELERNGLGRDLAPVGPCLSSASCPFVTLDDASSS